MSYKVGADKNQMSMMPMCLDDFVPVEHICRVISAFTKQLDMVELGYKYAEFKEKGCPPYDPRMMLDLICMGICTECVHRAVCRRKRSGT